MNDLTQFDHEGVAAFARDYEAVFYTGDFRRMASFYTDDAKLIASEIDTIHGREAIEQFWRAACEHAKSAGITRRIQVDEVTRAGDLGYLRTTVTIRVGDAPAIAIRDVTIWARAANGAWHMTIDISCASPRPDRGTALPYVRA